MWLVDMWPEEAGNQHQILTEACIAHSSLALIKSKMNRSKIRLRFPSNVYSSFQKNQGG